MVEKTCRRCHRTQSVDSFHADKTKKDGLYTICKDCRAGKSMLPDIPNGYRWCKICGDIKPDYAFYPAPEGVTRRTCILCSESRWNVSYQRKTKRIGNGFSLLGGLSATERKRIYRSNPEARARDRLADKRYKDSEKGKIKSSLWRSNNKLRLRHLDNVRRTRKLNLIADLSINDWLITLDAFNHQCAYCGCDNSLAQDHWIPLTKGGAYTLGNIVPACKSCNSSKCNRLPERFCKTADYLRINKTLLELVRNHRD